MIKNYLKIAFRNIRRQPGFSVINVGGLAIGLAACMLIALYIFDELQFDRFNQNYDRLYRVVEVGLNPDGDEVHGAYTAGPVGPALVEEMPEVVKSVRLVGSDAIGRRTVQHGENRFYESSFFFTEPQIFELFDYEWIQGDPRTALVEPNTVILTQKAATRYFGNANPLGQTLAFEYQDDLQVTGVIKDPPQNAHLQFNFLASFSTLTNQERFRTSLQRWEPGPILTYVLLRDADDAPALLEKVPAFIARHRSAEELVEQKLYLQPMSDIHFHAAHIQAEENANEGNLAYIKIFAVIAGFLLLIACVNYVNLATAQAMTRAREVGVRKALGARHQQLVSQFLGESGIITLLAATVSLILLIGVLPYFNQLTGKEITLSLETGAFLWLGLPVLLLVVWMITGGYPALYLTRFKPVGVLKGQFKAGTMAVRVRQGLVVTQFALSIALIIGTFAIGKQLS